MPAFTNKALYKAGNVFVAAVMHRCVIARTVGDLAMVSYLITRWDLFKNHFFMIPKYQAVCLLKSNIPKTGIFQGD
jgi:hypothetical protein